MFAAFCGVKGLKVVLVFRAEQGLFSVAVPCELRLLPASVCIAKVFRNAADFSPALGRLCPHNKRRTFWTPKSSGSSSSGNQ